MKPAEAIDRLPSLRLTVEAAGLMAKKALGQNFLLDRNITDKIIRLSLEKQQLENYHGAAVYEVGPGPGGLTRAVISAEPENFTVIEMDERCVGLMHQLKDTCFPNLEIVQGDALIYDFCQNRNLPCHIVSNLPYNISVPLLLGWLKEIGHFQSLTLMFQKEVGERIMAQPKSKDYGRISILSQLQCRIEKLLDLNPQCFVPAPKIWSSVLLFRPKSELLSPKEIKNIEHLTTLAFGQRRKMLRQSLKLIPDLEEKLSALNIPLTARAEELTPEQYLALARLL